MASSGSAKVEFKAWRAHTNARKRSLSETADGNRAPPVCPALLPCPNERLPEVHSPIPADDGAATPPMLLASTEELCDDEDSVRSNNDAATPVYVPLIERCDIEAPTVVLDPDEC